MYPPTAGVQKEEHSIPPSTWIPFLLETVKLLTSQRSHASTLVTLWETVYMVYHVLGTCGQ